MKQYIYSPHEFFGDDRPWPPGELVLALERTLSPEAADIFVVPGTLSLFQTQQDFYKLPHFKGREHRHVILGQGESETFYGLPCLFLRTNLKQSWLASDPNSIAVPWPIDDFNSCSPVPAAGFSYDISFHGWDSGITRRTAIRSCKRQPVLKTDMCAYRDFYGRTDPDEQLKRRRRYKDSLHRSRVALCPETIPGDVPYRFYEAMSAARIPLLISSNHVLPFADVIDYNAFSRTLPTAEADAAGSLAVSLHALSTEFVVGRGKLAQRVWGHYLDPQRWAIRFAEAVERKLKEAVVAI